METVVKLKESLWLISSLIGLGACAHAQSAQPGNQAKLPVVTAPSAGTSPTDSADEKARRAEADRRRMLEGSVLHFGFDEANLTPESRERLFAIAEIMRAKPSLAVRVAGNCDERGTEEYNLALGERRASVAKLYLVNLGIDGDRIGTISYGKDRPAVAGHDERAWAEDRRDEFQPTRGL